MKTEQVNELIYQMLETERRGGIQVYETALRSVVNAELGKSGESTWSRRGITSASCSR